MHYHFAVMMLRLLLMFKPQYPKLFDLQNQGTTHTLNTHLFRVKCTLGISNMQYCAMHYLCTKQEAEDLRRILHTKNIFNFTTIAQNAKMPKVGQARLHVRRSTHTCNQSQTHHSNSLNSRRTHTLDAHLEFKRRLPNMHYYRSTYYPSSITAVV